MPHYRVIHKRFVRARTQVLTTYDGSGTPFHQVTLAAPRVYEVGDLIDDLTPEELATLANRFVLVDNAPAQPPAAPQDARPTRR